MYMHTAPSGPPQSVVGTPESSRAIMLMWSPPPAIHINGIIQKYVVKITENETSQMWTFFAFNDENIVVGSLHPHYHYDCRVAAFTIAEGTLSNVVTVQTEQERKLKHSILLKFRYPRSNFTLQHLQLHPHHQLSLAQHTTLSV